MSGAALRAPTRATVLDRLRAETREAHDRVERELDWARRVATLDGYRALLARWWGFHAVVEPALERALARAGETAFLTPRRKLPLLADDLRQLGLAGDGLDALPLCSWEGPAGGLPGALGTLYVLEGSTLGGQVVARHIRRTLGLEPGGAGCRFYAAYGPGGAGPMWQATCARLLAVDDSAAEDAMVAAARLTFERVRDWLVADEATPAPVHSCP